MGTTWTTFAVRLFTLFTTVLLLAGCGGGGGGGGSDIPPESTSSIAVAASGDGSSIVAADADGNVLVNDLGARSVTMVNPDRSQDSVIYYGTDYLPTMAVVGGYVILYSNWTANTVDIATIAPDGTYRIQRGVAMDANFISLAAAQAASSSLLASSALMGGKGFSSIFRSASLMQKAAICNISDNLSALGVPRERLTWPCQTDLLTVIGSKADDYDWEQEQGGWVRLGGISCYDTSNCLTYIEGIADKAADAAEDTISQAKDAVDSAQDELKSEEVISTPLVVGIASLENGTILAAGQSVNLRGSITGGTGPFTFKWTINGGSISSSAVQNPGSVTFSNPGTYTISFLVTDSGNQTSSSTITITVKSAATPPPPPPSDTTPPTISSVVPANFATNVATSSSISVTFSESVNPATVTISTFIVTAGSGGITVPGAVTCTGATATFTPASSLTSGTTYTATITTGVRDLAGNALDSNASWTFTTIGNPSAAIIALLNSMVHIPGGSFQMGSTQNSNAQPVHTVTLADYEIGAFEVTQDQFLAVMGTNPSQFQGAGRGNCPVDSVTWNEAREFCTRLSTMTGRTFSLPSEAQWEYACRAGTTTRYSFGDSDTLLTDYAWCWYNTGQVGISGPQPVGTKLPNPWGLYDMHGNQMEWCLDSWHSNYTGAPADGSAWEPDTGTYRVLRSGAWSRTDVSENESANRMYHYPDSRYGMGFRVVAVPGGNLDHGLVAYYLFNGSATDESGHGNTGIVYGATLTTDRFGNENSAYNFDGINDYIDCGGDSSIMPTGQITVSVWIKSNAIQTGYILGRNFGNLDGYQLFLSNQLDNATSLARFGIDNTLIYSDSPIENGGWNHLVMTYDGSTLRGYVNGELQSSTGTGMGTINSAINNLRIGLQGPNDAGYATSYPFHGCIDDIRIYNRALSSYEVQNLFFQDGGEFVIDKDNDGLDFNTELLLGTDPDDADTDDDGILDGQEDANHNGTVDLWETNPLNFDTDGDGIQDGTELGITLAMVGPHTDLAVFQPDLDPTTTTSAVSNDTDYDGIRDGAEDTNHNGRVDAGEHDPNVFTDTTPPTVLSVNPLNNAVDVAIDTPITVTFSESVNPATVTLSTFVVTAGSGGITVPGAVTCTGATATFTPTSPLTYSTTYTATITTGVRDLAGNPFESNASWAFTTVSAPNTGPLAYYPFNGSAEDASGNNYDGVQSGDISYVAGPADTYVRAGGLSSDAYIDCGDINALDGITQLTAVVWVKPLNRNNLDYYPIFSKEDSCSNGFGGFNLVLSRTGEILWSLDDASGHALTRISPAGTVNLNEWQQITVVFDGSQSAVENKARIYINGTKVLSVFYGSNNYPLTATYSGNVSSLWIARSRGNSCGYSYFDGYMNELRFYTRVMPESEILNLYSQDWQKHYERASAWQVTTLAGSPGIHGTADGTGSAARFYHPLGMAVDGAGTIYIGDYYNSAVRKVTPAGVVTTLAGVAGSGGYADGTGSTARFSAPAGVAVDSSGNVYVADSANFVVRKISPEGAVTTLAGLAGTRGSADGAGTAARFYDPAAVAVDDSGNVYVSDAYNNTIRKITPEGVVSTLAGTALTQGSADGTGAAARFYLPANLVVDHAGNVYVADCYNHTIRKITPSGVVTTVAGLAGYAGSTNGTGSTARFNAPYGLCMDPSGNLYVGDNFNHTLRKITPGGVVTTIAGAAGIPGSADGDSLSARFNRVIGVAFANNGTIYLNDYMNHTVRKLTPYTFVSTEDNDSDGLINATELLLGTDPDDADTDDDGILDGQEDIDHNGTVDLWETNPLFIDTDGDGIQDGTEQGVTLAMVGSDTDLAFFQPDLDPTSTTSSISSDTDHDGISDGAEDTNHNGRVDAGENDPNVFTDTTPPTIISVNPLHNAVNVAVDTPITVTFSESIDPTTVTASSFIVTEGTGGVVVPGTFSCSEAVVTFTPSSSLNQGMTYTYRITTSIRDLSGNSLASDYYCSFFTSQSSTSSVWNKIFGGSGNEYAYSVQPTSDGGYMIAGGTGSVGGYGGLGWLFKIDVNGNEVWNKTYTGIVYALFLEHTNDGGYIFIGYTYSSDMCLVKTDAYGNEIWRNTFDGSSYDFPSSVHQTSDGGYILAGTAYLSDSTCNVWLIKTDTNGDEVWNRTFGGSSTDGAASLLQTNDGGYILAGYTCSYGNGGGADAWLIKTDANGNEVWNRTFGSDGTDIANSIQQASDGGYIIAGNTSSYGHGGSDAWLIKTDANGNEVWNRTYGGSNDEWAYCVQNVNDGGYILTGVNSSLVTGDYEAYIVKTDTNGNESWYRTYGGSATDYGHSIQQTGDGGYIMSGYTMSFGAGNFDAWLIKTDANGNAPTMP